VHLNYEETQITNNLCGAWWAKRRR